MVRHRMHNVNTRDFRLLSKQAMNSSEFNLQDHSQMISSNSRLDDNNNRDDVRVDENSHDGDMRVTLAGTDIGTMNTKVEVHAFAHSSFSGGIMDKHHTPLKRDPDEKSGLKSKSNSPPPSHEKKATLRDINADEGESHDVNVIDDPPTTITGAGMSETSLPSYYTDNIAAACAATNDELASGVPTGGSSRGEGENNSETRKRQKRARHKRQPSSVEDKFTKRSFEQDLAQQNTAESSAAVSLVLAELQRENLALVQENAALKQNVQHLSYLLERSLAVPPRGDFNTLLAQAALMQQQPQALSPPGSLQPHLSQFLTTTTQASLGPNSGALQHASDPQVASLLGIGGNESSQEQHVQAEQQRLRVASILSALGSSGPPPPSSSTNPLLVSSVLSAVDNPSRTGSQSSSLLEQLLLGSSPAVSKGVAPTATALLGGDASTTPTFSELQRYVMEGRGNTSLGGSLSNSHNSSRKGAVATEPVGASNVTTFSSTLQQQAIPGAALPPRHGLPDNCGPTIRGTKSTQSQKKRTKHKGVKHP